MTSRTKTVSAISIHALLAESDSMPISLCCGCCDFYPRSPCGERPFVNCNSNFTQKFLSTLSLRRATRRPGQTAKANRDFYPRSPCGERPSFSVREVFANIISIHALLAESDLRRNADCNYRSISIHALLAESDRFPRLDVKY